MRHYHPILLFLFGFLFFPLSQLLSIDLDGNGRSDIWDDYYGVSPLADNSEDNDYDGFDLSEESLLGTAPDSFSSGFSASILRLQDGGLLFSLQTEIGKIYHLQQSNTLEAADFSDIADASISGDGEIAELLLVDFQFESGHPVFFRFRLAGEEDADSDGLTAWEESKLGISDSQTDSDGDQVDDLQEYENQTDPAVVLDSDGDGMADDWERHHFGSLDEDGTSDGDGDTLSDRDEFALGLDPATDDLDNPDAISSYTYSLSGRLTEASGPVNASYLYDAEGNLTEVQ